MYMYMHVAGTLYTRSPACDYYSEVPVPWTTPEHTRTHVTYCTAQTSAVQCRTVLTHSNL